MAPRRVAQDGALLDAREQRLAAGCRAHTSLLSRGREPSRRLARVQGFGPAASCDAATTGAQARSAREASHGCVLEVAVVLQLRLLVHVRYL